MNHTRFTLRADGDRLKGGLLHDLDARDVFAAEPRRTFRWHRGQRHYPGRYWSATTGNFVGYESRLELAVLLLEDFDQRVVRIASQPFELIADRDGTQRSYVPDYMIEHRDQRFTVIEVKPRRRLEDPEIAGALEWAGQIIQSRGWGYRIVTEPDPALLSNVRFLAGYRRAWQFPGRDVDAATASTVGARTLGEAFRSAGSTLDDIAYARAAVLHLLWRHLIQCDLTSVLEIDTAVETR
ncbi:TnsA-like heteromeric transposase endonuclease subunit [Microbacterium sp. CnD16-F]|uniref:TnsA-like heteromeric transposase endonuclease subunit n=1 Tax=Microbacterium sp. CnD16-F TaxID=2954493 RepID=UPI002097A1B5|nr:TnsA-like heteromeric transposase endonuclease subunit [Microbacterium sp. CnD16-F]MCO7204441.1 TnsA-like heteromeric transposase endonuclease subunit [Microbacterium sp. CnD16-F]